MAKRALENMTVFQLLKELLPFSWNRKLIICTTAPTTGSYRPNISSPRPQRTYLPNHSLFNIIISPTFTYRRQNLPLRFSVKRSQTTYRTSTTAASKLHTDSIYGPHTDLLHENCSNKIILAHCIVNRTILIFQRFYNIEISTTIIWELT
jgi:hypothetical protein